MAKPTAQETGPSLRDVAVLAMARLEAAPDLLGGWSDVEAQSLRQAAGRVLDGQIDAARVMSAAADRLVSGIDLVPFLEPDGPFGPAWPAHPLASSAFNVGYRLREPDITRELAAFMGPRAGRQGNVRALSFLRILTDLAGAHEIGATLTDGVRPTIAAEHHVTRMQRPRTFAVSKVQRVSVPRIDLLFQWPVDKAGRQAVVVVEAKLGAHVGKGQLRPYREEARRRARGGPVALVLLTAWGDKAETRHRAWRPVRWFGLLRRWEAALASAGDLDPEFTRVRADLWRFVLSARKALS